MLNYVYWRFYMNWTEIKINVPQEFCDTAAAIANMTVPYGIYIEDYSDLEPMAKEIEQKQQNNCDELIKAIGELKSALESKIAMLENKIANLEKFQQEKERQSTNAMQQVKWDE